MILIQTLEYLIRRIMISRYEIFCKVAETGSFTKVAEQVGYTQSAISQIIKSLEYEFGTRLINRNKDGLNLTLDGNQYLPYFKSIYYAEKSLLEKKSEMDGLENSTICIGTFTSVSRTILPKMMKEFKMSYPGVKFILKQGEYTSISNWIKEGSVDFGFIHSESACKDLQVHELYSDEMAVVIPKKHPLSSKKIISLKDIESQPFILLDEGEYSLPLTAFSKLGIKPHIEYRVYDDYSILE